VEPALLPHHILPRIVEEGSKQKEPIEMDVFVLLVVTACGVLGAPVAIVLLAAVALTLMSAWRKIEIARTYPDVGTSRVLLGALLLSLANNTVFSLLSFVLGRGVSLLL
jgi:hypothetical protein